jgi:hypothetical protein
MVTMANMPAANAPVGMGATIFLALEELLAEAAELLALALALLLALTEAEELERTMLLDKLAIALD